MILRSVMKHVKDQNWFAVVLDFFIVVVGVYIGIEVANWNDERKDRADEKAFLQALHQDIVQTEEISGPLLQSRINDLKTLVGASQVLFERAPLRPLTRDECDVISYSHIVGVILPDLPSWAALQDAGRTGILKDEAILRGLAGLTQRQEAMTQITDGVSKHSFDLPRLHPELFQIVPDDDRSGRISNFAGFDYTYECDIKKLMENSAFLHGLAVNLTGYIAAAKVYGIEPWIEQLTGLRAQLGVRLGIVTEGGNS